MPKISILVPIYNVADKIERCAVSLFEQTYKDIEYVFVNDCTPDNSIEILESVLERFPERKKQTRIINHEHNKGLAGARNTGYDNATGELLMIVDSDDYLPLDACEKLYNEMQETGADIVSGAYAHLLPKGKTDIIQPSSLAKEKYLKRHLCLSFGNCSLWARLYKAELFHGLRAIEGVNLSEDYMMTSRVMLNAKMTTVSSVVYYYDETDVRDYSKIYQRYIEQAEKSVNAVLDYYKKNPEGARYLSSIQMAFLNVEREACRNNIKTTDIRPHLKPWAKIIANLMAWKLTYKIGNMLYKTARSIVCK